jgi:chorismate synthase
MSNTLGKLFRISIFGESHGPAVGCVIDGLPSGKKMDTDRINQRLNQRKATLSGLTTGRIEPDTYQILSGLYKAHTSGTPLTVCFENTNTRSQDYTKFETVFRPSHADYSGHKKYYGFNDPRGGGHFSARLTAPIVFAGALAEQLLDEMGISIWVQIQAVGGISGKSFLNLTEAEVLAIDQSKYQMQESCEASMIKEVQDASAEKDSVGGLVECMITGVPAGFGAPFFNSIESELSKAMFSIPGVKGIEFGSGFDLAHMKGSEANDRFIKDADGEIKTQSNHNGGISGGVSNGMPVVFRCVFKPTASIGKTQETLDFKSGETTELVIEGRHDPAIVMRAPAVVRAMVALVFYDLYLVDRGIYGKTRKC